MLQNGDIKVTHSNGVTDDVIIPTITISPVIVGTIDDIEFEAYRQQPHPLLGGGCWEIIFRKKTTPGMFSFGIKNLAIFWSSHTFAEIGE